MKHFAENGFAHDFSYLIDAADDKVLYSKGSLDRKARIMAKSFKRRQADVKRLGEYDIVFVQREAFMTGTTLFERKFAKASSKLIFDFDDSIWLSNVSEANRYLNFLKKPEKTSRIIAMSDHVIAGNQYLADYALRFNPVVSIIPTTIDTESYKPVERREERPYVTIGWSGSITTIQHFNHAEAVLIRVREKYGDHVRFKVIGDAQYANDALGIQGQAWNGEREISDLCEMDIGIMPLPDDEWAKGKCGLKGLQYMALEIATVMSPVGVNTDIIEEGVNGFLAADEDEWFAKLCALIDDAALRQTIGKAGRRTVEEKYSVIANAESYLRVFRAVLGE
ncbi:MAG: glycosyltransferase family 4 protein [Cryomorphaceae bacterium]